MNVLKDKVAIVTGSSSGIGYATATLFAQEGAKVVVAGRRNGELDALVGEIEKAGREAIAVAGGVKEEAHARALVDRAVNQFGGLDIAFSTVGFPGMSAYAAANAGIVGLTQVLAAEFGAMRIRANAILPGSTDTPANHANLPGAPEGTRAVIEGLHALKRLGRPEEIAQSALYLVSDASSFITSVALLVDGGVSINQT